MNFPLDEITKFINNEIRPKDALIIGGEFEELIEQLSVAAVEVSLGLVEGIAFDETTSDRIHDLFEIKVNTALPQDFDLIILDHSLRKNPEIVPVVNTVVKHTETILITQWLPGKDSENVENESLSGWANLLAEKGFFRDFQVIPSDLTGGVALYRRLDSPISNVIAHYEDTISSLQEEVDLRREQTQELRRELFSKDQIILERSDFIEEKLRRIEDLNDEVKAHSERILELNSSIEALKIELEELSESHGRAQISWEQERDSLTWKIVSLSEELEVAKAEKRAFEIYWDDVQVGIGWKLLHQARVTRLRLAPPGSTRDRILQRALYWLRGFRGGADAKTTSSIHVDEPSKEAHLIFDQGQSESTPIDEIIPVLALDPPTKLKIHEASIDIIVCVHNALDDVRRCLESVLESTTLPYHLLLVDDGSEAETQQFLESFSAEHQATLLRNEQAGGYTRAANQGLRRAKAEYALLLNSDTVVTDEWVDRMIAIAESDDKIGLVGPLSNTASWQSIPEIEKSGDWASNPLPNGVTINEMGRWVKRFSPRLWPWMPLLNGFCLLIKRDVIAQVGYFDEDEFGDGYGEEDDYILRAREMGWECALADDVYVYHAQSQSYSTERRRELYQIAGKKLIDKHGESKVQEGVAYCLSDRVLEGIRARSRVLLQRQDLVKLGSSLFEGKRILFILPIAYPGGGGNVVTLEGQSMVEMGVEVGIFNLNEYRERFERAYPDFPFPVHYGGIEDLASISEDYDAVVATYNPSVEWMNKISRVDSKSALGYYIQGYEPYMYEKGSPDYEIAKASYSAVPDLVRFTKTRWTREEVLEYTGMDSNVVGVSADIDLFRTRPTSVRRWPDAPLRICAMVRPASPYRSPRMTLKLLRKAREVFASKVDIILFGSSADDPEITEISGGFPWNMAGVLNRSQMAQLLNQTDIFVDFSEHQAMGLTALEAMACGVAVIVPSNGGAVTFAQHGANSLVVDTSYEEACWRALYELIDDDMQREAIRSQAIHDVCSYYPERPAFRILSVLFPEEID
jgi:GT2 family glycosyltransferase/uncharacterized protein YoxC